MRISLDPLHGQAHDYESEWLASLPVVRLELGPEAVFNRVWVNGEEWQASVKRIAIDVEKNETLVTLSFYAKVTAEGPVALRPWPIIVESESSQVR
jgi:hypothetical protein